MSSPPSLKVTPTLSSDDDSSFQRLLVTTGKENLKTAPPVSMVSAAATSATAPVEEVSVFSVHPPQPGDEILSAGLDDVELDNEPVNPLKKGQPDEAAKTRLRSIKGTTIQDLQVRVLRSFCSRLGVKGIRTLTKRAMCKIIVDEVDKAAQTKKSAPIVNKKQAKKAKAGKAKKTDKAIVNRKRFINVLFSEVMRPLFAVRGETLTRSTGLDDGMRTDQSLFETFIAEYNSSNEVYTLDAFPEINFTKDASRFDPLPDWTKARTCMNDMAGLYETARANWKKSGTHDDFSSTLDMEKAEIEYDIQDTDKEKPMKPFRNFSSSNLAVLYFHLHMVEHPGLFEPVLSLLPSFAKREIGGVGGRVGGGNTINSWDTRKQKAQLNKEESIFLTKSASKSEAIELAIKQDQARKDREEERKKQEDKIEARIKLTRFVQEQKDRKRALLDVFSQRIQDSDKAKDEAVISSVREARKQARTRYQSWQAHIQSGSPGTPATDFFESQESILEDIFDLDQSIQATTEEMKKNNVA